MERLKRALITAIALGITSTSLYASTNDIYHLWDNKVYTKTDKALLKSDLKSGIVAEHELYKELPIGVVSYSDMRRAERDAILDVMMT